MRERSATRGRNRASGSVDVYIGKRIRARRAELGVSQHNLASRIGVTFQQIQKYEHGRNRCGPARLIAIAKALQVPIGYLLPAETEKFDYPPDEDILSLRLPALLEELRAVLQELEKLVSKN